MTTRELPFDEWDRLSGTELETIRGVLDPQRARVLVVETDEGDIIGCWALFAAIHTEGFWIEPSHRKQGGVARRLLLTMREWLKVEGVRAVMTAAHDTEMAAYLTRLGATELPGVHYVWPVKES